MLAMDSSSYNMSMIPLSPPPWLLSLETSEKKKELQRSSVPQNHSGIFSPDFHVINVPNAFITRLKNFRLCNIN